MSAAGPTGRPATRPRPETTRVHTDRIATGVRFLTLEHRIAGYYTMDAASNQLDDLLAEMQCELYGAVEKAAPAGSLSTQPVRLTGQRA